MTRPLNFQQIQAFKAVVETGTTTRAAQVLSTTQPSISRRLAELQEASGLELFDLHHGRLRPTREALQLYRSVRKHFDGLEQIETAVRVLRKSGTGVLRIGSTPTLAMGLLPSVTARFIQQNPEVYISLRTSATQQLKEWLSQGMLDLVLTTSHIEHADVIAETLLRTRAVCVLPQGHVLSQHRRLEWSQLRGERLILLDESDDIRIAMRKSPLRFDGDRDRVVETNSSITICALVAAGVGAGIVNPFVARTFTDRLVVCAIEPPVPIDVSLARSAALAPSLLTKRFTDLLGGWAWADPASERDVAGPSGAPG